MDWPLAKATCSALQLGRSLDMAFTHCVFVSVDYQREAMFPAKRFTVSDASVQPFGVMRARVLVQGIPASVFDGWVSECKRSRSHPTTITTLVLVHINVMREGRILDIYKDVERKECLLGERYCDAKWKQRLIREVAEGRLRVGYHEHE